ncbi:MAG: succinylglutamate desuccinylase/aspartoacylase family protein [Candidatus Nanohalobium sp.]
MESFGPASFNPVDFHEPVKGRALLSIFISSPGNPGREKEMRVEKLGDGEPEVAVVGSIHGDEPCGKKAIERFIESDFEIQKAVKLIVANEKGLDRDARYIDCDLNRCFPGDLSSENYEERIAAEILEQVRELNTLSLHSTKSYADPFAAQSVLDEGKMELISKTGVRVVSHHAAEDIGCLSEYSNTVAVECGFQGSESAAENAFRVLKNFLAAHGVIDDDFREAEPEIFRVYDTVEKPEFEFTAVNFQKVEEGDVYARDRDRVLRAEEDFYPVLMSSDGYEEILGHKAEKVKNRKEYIRKQT